MISWTRSSSNSINCLKNPAIACTCISSSEQTHVDSAGTDVQQTVLVLAFHLDTLAAGVGLDRQPKLAHEQFLRADVMNYLLYAYIVSRGFRIGHRRFDIISPEYR